MIARTEKGKPMKRWLTVLLYIVLSLAMSGAAHASLVVNGSFQGFVITWDNQVLPAPSWDGWSQSPAVQGSNYYLAGLQNAPSLFQAAFAGPGPDSDAIGQTIQTVAGQSYTFSFWLTQPADLTHGYSPGDFEAFWNGAPVLSITSAIQFPWTPYTFAVSATGPSTTVGFSGRGNTSWDDTRGFFLTGVSVSPAIAEPGIMILLGAGLLFLAGWRLKSSWLSAAAARARRRTGSDVHP
jgi:hypothetical protein